MFIQKKGYKKVPFSFKSHRRVTQNLVVLSLSVHSVYSVFSCATSSSSSSSSLSSVVAAAAAALFRYFVLPNDFMVKKGQYPGYYIYLFFFLLLSIPFYLQLLWYFMACFFLFSLPSSVCECLFLSFLYFGHLGFSAEV